MNEDKRQDAFAAATEHLPPLNVNNHWVWSPEETQMLRLACQSRFNEDLRTESLYAIAATGVRISFARQAKASAPRAGELLPCPFCGAKDERLVQQFVRATESFAYWSVECLDCACEIASDTSQEEADTAWNRRAPVCAP